MISCSKCKCDLSPEEKDDLLSAIAYGIPAKPICEDCRDEIMNEDDPECYDTDDEDGW